MKGKDSLPIYCWIEDLDEHTFAVVARCFVVKRGCWFGLAVFTLVDRKTISTWERYKWKLLGEQRLIDTLRTKHMGALPVICHVQSSGTKDWGLG